MSKELENKIEKKLSSHGFWKFPLLKSYKPQVLKSNEQECMLKFKLHKLTKDDHNHFFKPNLDTCSHFVLQAFSYYCLILDKRKLQLDVFSTSINYTSACTSDLRVALMNVDTLLSAIEEAAHTQSTINTEAQFHFFDERNDLIAQLQHNISISL